MPLSTNRLARLFERDRIAVLGTIHANAIAFGILALEYGDGERILEEPLDRPLERARAVHRIVTLGDEQLLRGRGHLDRDLAVGQQAFDPLDLDVHDTLDIL